MKRTIRKINKNFSFVESELSLTIKKKALEAFFIC